MGERRGGVNAGGGWRGSGREVPVGTGDVDWPAYMASLEAIGYQGYLVADREAGAERFAGVAADVQFLRRFVTDDRLVTGART